MRILGDARRVAFEGGSANSSTSLVILNPHLSPPSFPYFLDWEFEYYLNNRTVSFVRNGSLIISPQLTVNMLGAAGLASADVNIWGGDPATACTGEGAHAQEARTRTHALALALTPAASPLARPQTTSSTAASAPAEAAATSSTRF